MNDEIYQTGVDPYVDPDSGILRNKLGLTTQADLDAAESDIASLEIVEMTVENSPSLVAADFDILKDIHHQIFKLIYDWAGELRTINVSKDKTKFCEFQFIEAEGKRIFDELIHDNFLRKVSDKTDFLKRLAYYYSELNLLHPFREGNGRTLRTFISILAVHSNGSIIAWDKMNYNENIAACAYAVYHDESKIERMMTGIIEFA